MATVEGRRACNNLYFLGDQFNIRFRRDIPTVTQPNNIALNELAKRVLSSIEAAFLAAQDNGECLRKNLCENNKYSRTLESSSKIWIPVWRFVSTSFYRKRLQ